MYLNCQIFIKAISSGGLIGKAVSRKLEVTGSIPDWGTLFQIFIGFVRLDFLVFVGVIVMFIFRFSNYFLFLVWCLKWITVDYESRGSRNSGTFFTRNHYKFCRNMRNHHRKSLSKSSWNTSKSNCRWNHWNYTNFSCFYMLP